MGKKFKNKICVYCGQNAADTADHVIARKFFPLAERKNLPKVPACFTCNSEKSALEHYLATVLLFGSYHPDAVKHLEDVGTKRLARNVKLQRELMQGKSKVWHKDKSGLYVRTMSIPFDADQLVSYSRYIVRGLIWHHWNQILSGSSHVFGICLNGNGVRGFNNIMAAPKATHVEGEFGQSILKYTGARGAENPEISVWQVIFFGGVVMAGDAKSPDELSTTVGVLTGPARILVPDKIGAGLSA